MKDIRRWFSLVLCTALLAGLLPTAALAADTPHNISQSTLTISRDGDYTITGTTTNNRIIVNSGVTATITLNGVSITAPTQLPAIDVQRCSSPWHPCTQRRDINRSRFW